MNVADGIQNTVRPNLAVTEISDGLLQAIHERLTNFLGVFEKVAPHERQQIFKISREPL